MSSFRGRSRQKRRRFGFLNLFGFSGDSYEAEADDIASPAGSPRSHSRQSPKSSRSSSRSRKGDNSHAIADHDHQDSSAQPVEESSEPTAAVDSGLDAPNNQPNAVISSSPAKMTYTTCNVSASSRPISGVLQGSSNPQQEEQPIAGHFATITPMRRPELTGASPQIRTCPIPERLRLQIRDSTAGISDSYSPTAGSVSASTAIESPRAIPDGRPRRRGTIGAFGTSADSSKNDKHISRAAEYSLYAEKTAIPFARRTSSNNSAWSTVTPTSVASGGDTIPAAAKSQTDHGVLPEWDQAGQPPSSRSRGRSRRYSVFDMSFASQQPGGAVGGAQPPASPISPRRGPSKSSLDVHAADSSSLSSPMRRQTIEPSPLFERGSGNVRRRSSSRMYASSPSTDMRGTYSHAHMSPSLAASGHKSPSLPHSRNQPSYSSMASLSLHNQPIEDVQPDSDMQLSAQEAESTSSRRRHRKKRSEMLSVASHESSSGHSTPTGLLFSRVHRERSASIKSANVAEIHRTWSPSGSARYSRQGDQPALPQFYRHGYSQGYASSGIAAADSDLELNDGDDAQQLKFTTSTPDILFMPMVYRFGEQKRTVKRPDYSYERLLALSRSTKAHRWRQRKSQAGNGMSRDYGTGSKSMRSSSLMAVQETSMRRQSVSTAALASPSISRQNSLQDRGAKSPMHVSASRSLRRKSSATSDIPWCNWTDSIKSQPHTDVVQRVVDMWQKVLRGWKRNCRSRVSSFGHRRDSSASNSINLPRTSDTIRSSIDSSVDKGLMVSSGFTAMLDPYVIEPIGLQRGVSESGRHSLPSNTASLMRQLTGYSQLDSLMATGDAFDKVQAKSTVSKCDSKSAVECKDDAPKQPALQRVSKLTTATGAMAPHRRLSIVKDHEIGRPASTSTPSASSEKSDDGASSASSNASLLPPDKGSWVLAQFEDTDEAVNVLLLFHARLQERLRKAKAESEEELLSITQGLSEFVEEGLSYVHEEYDDEHAHAGLADEPDSDDLYLSDGAETPGLTMSGQRFRVEDPVASLHNSASRSSQGHWTAEAASKQLELKSLNRRLHDVLNQHGNSAAASRSDVRSMPNQPEISEAKAEKQLVSPMRLPRVPSIRRMAFLRSISGEGGSKGGAVNTLQPETKDSTQSSEPHPLTDLTESDSVCCHDKENVPCIVCTSSVEDSEHDDMQPRTWHSAQNDSAEYFGNWKARQRTHSSLPSAIPFPDLHKRRSTQSINSSRPESRSSVTRRSASRASIYSSGSASSLVTSPLIAEDEFKPTPFLEAIMDLVNIIGHVLNLKPEDMLRPLSGQLLAEALCYTDGSEEEQRQMASLMPTAYLVQRLTDLGNRWEQSQTYAVQGYETADHVWPCRGLFFRALLAISSLNRIVIWYTAVRAAYSDEIIAELDRRIEQRQLDSQGEKQQQMDMATPKSLSKDAAILQANAADDLWSGRKDNRDVADSVFENTQRWRDRLSANQLHWQRADEDEYDTDKGLNMLVEISLEGRIRYISPTCEHLLGADPELMTDQPATAIFDSRDVDLCRSAVEQLLADNSQTVELNIRVHPPDHSCVVNVEAKGMLIYNRATGDPSHVLWVMRYLSAEPSSSQQPSVFGNDAQATSQGLSTAPYTDMMSVARPGELLAPPLQMEPITCRICDRSIPAAYFEEHSWLCAKSHRAAMEVERQNDRLGDIKAQLQSWYPGCSFEELEELIHGEIDADALRERAHERAQSVGSSAWQQLVDESNAGIKSMVQVCTRAQAIDASDSAPQCQLHPEQISQLADNDFARSDAWVKVASYTCPSLNTRDSCLEILCDLLLQAISDKLTAIDTLQYAIIDSALAYTKWMSIEDTVAIPEVAGLHSLAAKSTSDLPSLANRLASGAETAHRQSTTESVALADIDSCATTSMLQEDAVDSQQSTLRRSQSSYSLAHRPSEASNGSRKQSVDTSDTAPQAASTSSYHDSTVSPSGSRRGSQLQITTSNLPATPTHSQGRASITSDALMATPTMPSIHDFDLLKPISKGAYGSVFLAKKRSTGVYYAIKILKKADMIAKNQISNVKAERAIMMAQTGSPFVVRLLYTFQSRTNLYLVMEYLNGGDCAALLKAIGMLPEEWTKQYLAEVVLGIEDLHARNVVHRDLKPDNLLIDAEGHLKLTDFGLSKLGFLGRRVGQQPIPHPPGSSDIGSFANLNQAPLAQSAGLEFPAMGKDSGMKTPLSAAPNRRVSALKGSHLALGSGSSSSTSSSSNDSFGLAVGGNATSASSLLPRKHALGTPDYIAPESILGLESGESVDWWALGVICYEFLFGIPPFHDETPEKVFQNILSNSVDFYDAEREEMQREKAGIGVDEEDDEAEIPDISPEARDFITRLLNKDPRQRLGHNGAAEVKAHPIFRGIDWDTLLETQPAFIPTVENMEDTDYFDPRGATMEHHSEYSEDSHLSHISEVSSSSSDSQLRPMSRSHQDETGPSLSAGVSIYRPNTLPAQLSHNAEQSSKASEGSSRKASRRDSKHYAHDDGVFKLDDEPEFGGFTFKNMHALEEANRNELVKLRRRSTLLGVRPLLSGASPDPRSSFVHKTDYGLSLPTRNRFSRSFTGSSAATSSNSMVSSEWPEFQPASASGYRRESEQGSSPLIRNATLPLLSAQVSTPDSESPYASNSVPGEAPKSALSLRPSHSRELSATHSQRGSMLNPNAQPTQSAHSSEHERNSSDLLSHGSQGRSVPAQCQPPGLNKAATLNSLHRSNTYQDTAAPAQAEMSEKTTDHLQSKVCLVADDNPVFCKIMEIILQRMHLKCVVVRNGAEAIRCAMGRAVYRAIFMDIGMPIVDGDEATRMIKSTYNANRDTPIIALSTYEDEANSALYDKVLVKPVTLPDIKKLLDSC
ncbi:rim15, signal transduction response regulator [Coemansia sp. RSA 2336]|nr:rim15, signal transduction response regulator [Coemansia sp. RSA 2336]